MGPFHFSRKAVAVEKAGPAWGRLKVPGSKSITNRYLLLAAMAKGESEIADPLESQDTVHMRAALAALGTQIATEPALLRVSPQPFGPPGHALFAGNAGTVMRFLAPLLASLPFATELAGDERMAERPIGDLVDALRELGATIRFGKRPGFPPLHFERPLRNGEVTVHSSASSQYLSGLLMVLPTLPGPSTLKLGGALVSRSYVEMTIACAQRFGASWQRSDGAFHTPGFCAYHGQRLAVPGDASTASYPLALPLMVGGQVEVSNLDPTSHQGDLGLLEVLARMGAKVVFSGSSCTVSGQLQQGVEVDMSTMSDVAPTLAVLATRAATPTRITGVGHMRHKECDRIQTLQNGFDRLGLTMRSGPDWMEIQPGRVVHPGLLDPEDDHRMAMVFALLGLADGGVSVCQPECVGKTWPDFWQDMAVLIR
jgi:3-phosphoshikimate 1-carboxyvinyltransferase